MHVVSVDHKFGTRYKGQYFNALIEEVPGLKAKQTIYKCITNERSQITRSVVIWGNANGGTYSSKATSGGAHGRYKTGAKPEDFQTGDIVTIEDDWKCDPCLSENNHCTAGAICTSVQNKGDFKCSCPSGYRGDGKDKKVGGSGCSDLDACQNNPCPTLEKSSSGYSTSGKSPTCTDNKAPSTGYTCSACPSGYQNKPVNNVCIGTKACASNPCGHAVAKGSNSCLELTIGDPDYQCKCLDKFSAAKNSGCTLDALWFKQTTAALKLDATCSSSDGDSKVSSMIKFLKDKYGI